MKAAPWILGLALMACGGESGGEDTLPKRGERSNDPTIVSASAECVVEGSALSAIIVRVAASDPMGQDNLGTATVEIDGKSDVDGFSSGSAGTSYNEIDTPCVKGTAYTVDITVANKTAGVTTASVSLTPL